MLELLEMALECCSLLDGLQEVQWILEAIFWDAEIVEIMVVTMVADNEIEILRNHDNLDLETHS